MGGMEGRKVGGLSVISNEATEPRFYKSGNEAERIAGVLLLPL